MSREEGVRAILAKLPEHNKQGSPFFEALIRVKVSGGVPVQPSLVSVRPHE